jgi:hypothetical protein
LEEWEESFHLVGILQACALNSKKPSHQVMCADQREPVATLKMFLSVRRTLFNFKVFVNTDGGRSVFVHWLKKKNSVVNMPWVFRGSSQTNFGFESHLL